MPGVAPSTFSAVLGCAELISPSLQMLDPRPSSDSLNDQSVRKFFPSELYLSVASEPGKEALVEQNLERLVSCHQLLPYPSEYSRFNRVYEEALACLKCSSVVRELYVVQLSANNGDLYFSFVPASLISPNGPYFLTDICGVLRK